MMSSLVAAGLRAAGYLPGDSTALVSHLAARLGKPVLVEGPVAVGQTELAQALARHLDRWRVRLPCDDGLDDSASSVGLLLRSALLLIFAGRHFNELSSSPKP